jgi:ABC-type Na+ transport system ATPase subunit NatA
MVAEIRGLPRAEAKKIEETVAEVKMNECLDKKVGKFSKEKNSPKPPYFAICD